MSNARGRSERDITITSRGVAATTRDETFALDNMSQFREPNPLTRNVVLALMEISIIFFLLFERKKIDEG